MVNTFGVTQELSSLYPLTVDEADLAGEKLSEASVEAASLIEAARRLVDCESTNHRAHRVPIGKTWTCKSCGKRLCWADGADDDMPDACDTCFAAAKRGERAEPAYDYEAWLESPVKAWTAEGAIIVGVVGLSAEERDLVWKSVHSAALEASARILAARRRPAEVA